MSAAAVRRVSLRLLGCAAVVFAVAAVLGQVGRVMRDWYSPAGPRWADGPRAATVDLPPPPAESDTFAAGDDDSDRFDRELLARLSERGAGGGPAALPPDLAVPEGARALAVPGLSAGGPAGMYAVESGMLRADAVEWLRRRMVELGWRVQSVRPGPAGDDRITLAKPDLSLCVVRIEDKPAGGCRIFYMTVSGAAIGKKTKAP